MKNTTQILMLVVIGFCLFGYTEALSATLTVTKTADTADGVCDVDCSLREAIAAAVTGDTIQFSTLFDTPQTITLLGSELVIDKELSIIGPGADRLIVSGNGQSRVIRIPELAEVNLSGFTITGGNAGVGGGIFNEGSLSIDSCHVTANTAGSGGGIGSLGPSGGWLAIRNSTISNNDSVDRGGGVWFDANVAFSTRTQL